MDIKAYQVHFFKNNEYICFMLALLNTKQIYVHFITFFGHNKS